MPCPLSLNMTYSPVDGPAPTRVDVFLIGTEFPNVCCRFVGSALTFPTIHASDSPRTSIVGVRLSPHRKIEILYNTPRITDFRGETTIKPKLIGLRHATSLHCIAVPITALEST
jgi:hypothetical protein